MFHRFSARPAKARSLIKGPGPARASNKNNNKNSNADSNPSPSPQVTVLPLAKRKKAARACDRCRLHRIKCDEQKPCAQCVSIKAECIVSYAPPRSSEANNSDTDHTRCEPSSVLSPSRTRTSQESSRAARTSPEDVHTEAFDLAHVQGFFASGQPAFAHTSALTGCLFPQLPYPAIPSGVSLFASNALLKSQRSYYLRFFWDACHPLLQIMSETEFAELDALSSPTMFDEYSARSALADSMVALGIQHSHATGLAGRLLGLPSSPEAIWPGFEYFHRCRECMRTSTEVTLEVLQCHTLMVLYLMKGNAFRDAYNLLGITVRKAYIAKLHRLPPSHLPEDAKTARMQLWWILFSLDFQCSLQLDMPTASQMSLVKCPFPTEDALARYVCSPSHREEGMDAYTYSTRLVNLAVIMTDIGACVSTADLVDDNDSNSPAALEHHALNLSSALQNLEVWRNQLPSKLRLSQCRDGSGNTEMLDFDRDLALPAWLQRQMVLLELHYHNAYTLIQRPFIRLRYTPSSDASGMITLPESQQPHVELHIASALQHATIIVDTVFTVCSKSDVLYGWSEALQPLWNATLTIVAYVYANALSSVVPRALDSLTRAKAVFESFSPTCPTALSAKDIVQSLANSLQNMTMHGSCAVANDNPMGWDLFPPLLEEQQTPPVGVESAASSNDLHSSMLFPFMPPTSHVPDFSSGSM
ncbi:hypothetical protein BJX76DRAFT_330935 [Aspergillus varians]